MADITEIRELAQKLNLWNIARGYIDLNDEKLSNLDYLELLAVAFTEVPVTLKHLLRQRSRWARGDD